MNPNINNVSKEHRPPHSYFLFFFNDTATTEIYTLSLHDALPILVMMSRCNRFTFQPLFTNTLVSHSNNSDRKSTRLNSSHLVISYAVFCLKKKNKRHISRTV